MKLVRYTTSGTSGERIGLLDAQGGVRRLDDSLDDAGQFRRDRLAGLSQQDIAGLERETGELVFLPPLTRLGKVIGVGLNYREHAIECGLAIPSEPTLFLKATSSLAAPAAPLRRPPGAQSLDWEVELGVVIGKPGSNIARETAMEHVAGYVLAIDFSERDFQFRRGGQGFKGKSCDSFGPLGPIFATVDECPDPQDILLELRVNGELRQRGSTSDMIFPVDELVSYISRFMSLQTGDVILSGTPAGVGMGMKPPAYLADGDVVEASSALLGVQVHRVVPDSHRHD